MSQHVVFGQVVTGCQQNIITAKEEAVYLFAVENRHTEVSLYVSDQRFQVGKSGIQTGRLAGSFTPSGAVVTLVDCALNLRPRKGQNFKQ